MTEPDPYTPGQTAENGRPICGAKKKDGNPCGASPAKGATRCRRHGGNTPQAKGKAKARVTTEKAGRALRNLGYDSEAENINPAEALLRLVSDKYREVAWLRMQVDHIQAGNNPGGTTPLVWGVTGHEFGVGPDGPIDKTTESSDLNIYVRWLHTAEDQLARYASAALKAGVEQRQLDIREAEALIFVGAINSILTALQLTTEQQQLVPTIVPQALRALEGRTA
ncbi:HGGxSTG domain-containing protein [Citricoccus sp. K5]|uniref:HGGxSTG domain-containing protein n=1 Tax=Citricoccus sp. K5 TaxID=2653135 RepID=UPI0012F372C5|nr:HGGxSTG domain-containing protein [Citricoccus sp. K5]VXA92724.1 conserved hypothetical protein [Citricoccus sp. K5]VXA95276.1 conserved hypothetical protein [Citricoccus sp. K5]